MSPYRSHTAAFCCATLARAPGLSALLAASKSSYESSTACDRPAHRHNNKFTVTHRDSTLQGSSATTSQARIGHASRLQSRLRERSDATAYPRWALLIDLYRSSVARGTNYGLQLSQVSQCGRVSGRRLQPSNPVQQQAPMAAMCFGGPNRASWGGILRVGPEAYLGGGLAGCKQVACCAVWQVADSIQLPSWAL